MKPEQQRIAIAKACDRYMPIPDYLNDLNAMHDAWFKLNDEQRIEYVLQLYHICVPECDQYDDHFLGWIQAGLIIHATAAQRAEAFLKTLNLWQA